MTDQLISLETALLANKKGFLNYADKCYCEDIDKPLWSDGLSESVTFITYAPTQSLLQKWLREIHWIHIVPECRASAGIYFTWIYKMNSDSTYAKSGKGATCQRIGDYQSKWTYEEALECGLIEALKLIK